MTTKYLLDKFRFVMMVAAVVLCAIPVSASAGDMKLEAVLVWGTNDSKPAGSHLKPITDDIAKKLGCLPFKYTNYFEVNRKQLQLKEGGSQSVSMSHSCKIEIRSLEDGKVELTLIGKGQPVGKITQELKKGKCLVTGGNAENSTAWFVVVRHME